MDVALELLAAGVATVAGGFAAFRWWGRRQIINSYRQGRSLRLNGDYAKANGVLEIASVGFPSARVLRFWMLLEQGATEDARVLLKEIPRSLAGQECACWMALRFDSLPAAEREVSGLLSLMSAENLPPWLHASAMYTHACLVIEEGNPNYAVERLSSSVQIARQSYGFDTLYAIPQTVALSYLYFLNGNVDKSAKLLARSLRIYASVLGEDHLRTARVRAMLAIVAGAMGFRKEAERDLKRAAGVFHSHSMVDGADAKAVAHALAWLRG